MITEASCLRLHYKGYRLQKLSYVLIKKWWWDHIVLCSSILMLFLSMNKPWWGLVFLPLLWLPRLIGERGRQYIKKSTLSSESLNPFKSYQAYNPLKSYEEQYPEYAEGLRLLNQEGRLRKVAETEKPIAKARKKI